MEILFINRLLLSVFQCQSKSFCDNLIRGLVLTIQMNTGHCPLLDENWRGWGASPGVTHWAAVKGRWPSQLEVLVALCLQVRHLVSYLLSSPFSDHSGWRGDKWNMRKLLFKTSSQNGHECLKFKPNTLENYFVIFFFWWWEDWRDLLKTGMMIKGRRHMRKITLGGKIIRRTSTFHTTFSLFTSRN